MQRVPDKKKKWGSNMIEDMSYSPKMVCWMVLKVMGRLIWPMLYSTDLKEAGTEWDEGWLLNHFASSKP